MAKSQTAVLPLDERPLVTFVLFAYNQEKYIREAAEGAFAQTYEPLEIILSDDGSTDRTFEIMEEMAAKYSGPHSVIVRRSPKNRGLGLHIFDVATLARGHFIIAAAGDDISLPTRAATLVALMGREDTQFAASNYNKMGEDGVLTELNVENDYSGNYVWELIDADPAHFANGAAAGYRSSFLRGALHAAISTLNSQKLFNEDILFAAYAVAIGQKPSNYTDAALVNYRINPISLSNFDSMGCDLLAEIKLVNREKFRSATRLAVIAAVQEIANNYPALAPLLNRRKMSIDKRLAEVELAASDDNIVSRVRSLLKTRTMGELKVGLARLFGSRSLARMRFVKRKIISF